MFGVCVLKPPEIERRKAGLARDRDDRQQVEGKHLFVGNHRTKTTGSQKAK